MSYRIISDSEIMQRQQDIRDGAWQARRTMSIDGIRYLVGSTFIAIGTRLHGCAGKRAERTVVPPRMAVPRNV